MADEEFVNEVNGPENPMNKQQEPTVVVVPADHQRIEAENSIEDARVRIVHVGQVDG